MTNTQRIDTFNITARGEDSIAVRTTKGDRHVIKVNGDQADELIRKLIAARGGEWADMLSDWTGGVWTR